MIEFDEITDLKQVTDSEAEAMCARLRSSVIDMVSRTGGHLASNLGVVELTVALHRVFDTGRDRLVFDVGHQCYIHKMLTGRGSAMDTLRTFGGLSGFPKPNESIHDAFIAGHASNSVSVALGMARARTLLGENYHVIALIGDGALTGGLAYEGLSNAGLSREPMLVILNDNGMSITKNVGGVAQHLAHQRLKPQYLRFKKGYRKAMSVLPGGKTIYRVTHKVKTAVKETLLPCSLFEDMGFTYLGPVDGNDVRGLTRLLRYAKDMEGPVLLHIRTVKGKGYPPAEQNPDAYHGVSKFCVQTGESLHPSGPSYSGAFGAALCQLAEEDRRVCAITAAMRDGTGLKDFEARFPKRFFDVGISEGHAVSMAAGLAKQGCLPVFAVYSSFLQRGYDMLLHDVAILGLHVVFGVDRAGLVGEDGETHHGLFDVAYLSSVPGMTLYAPSSFAEVATMLRHGLLECNGPVALRYPRGGEGGYHEDAGTVPTLVTKEGQGITLVAYGATYPDLLAAAEQLEASGCRPEIIKLNRLCPLDLVPVCRSVSKTGRLLVAEEAAAMGSVGERLCAGLAEAGIALKAVRLCNTGERFVPQGTVEQLRHLCGLDSHSLYEAAMEVWKHE
ncbi:1-deoxy-D-xylulose-5-phosphate synthase [Intestinimonas sp.]|uniref:1-deoxy-D-xylulose-5-phosphate synthase n=1 Tax=Intestinimonas sp. TaxID=1965293 RepID=UPI00262CBA25|nr:1-deoxy-D-xylulose-5-phosphate synthase [Intestinimonas sp.]